MESHVTCAKSPFVGMRKDFEAVNKPLNQGGLHKRLLSFSGGYACKSFLNYA
jgi:hypothetical protein